MTFSFHGVHRTDGIELGVSFVGRAAGIDDRVLRMILRILTILAILVQPLVLPAALADDAQSESRESCCQVVVQASCCEATVAVSHHCGMPDGVCICGVSPNDAPRDPWVPTVREGLGTVFILARKPETICHRASLGRLVSQTTLLTIRGSHNQTRALLCNWRT